MCIEIAIVDVGFELVFWSRRDVRIYVRSDAPPAAARDEIRAILADLDAPPSTGQHYTCFCGEPIPQTPGLPAATATHHRIQEVRYGA